MMVVLTGGGVWLRTKRLQNIYTIKKICPRKEMGAAKNTLEKDNGLRGGDFSKIAVLELQR